MKSDLTAHHPDGVRLVGRREFLADLRQRVERGDNLVLRGPPGVGKTRLASELVLSQAKTGRNVERLLGSTGTSTYHLGLFAAAYGHPTGVGPGDVGMLFDAYLGRWRSAVRHHGPTMLWVDDAPDVDDLSASLLRQAATAGLVQLVITARADHTLPPDFEAMIVEGRLYPVDVAPLSAANSAVLARLWSPNDMSADEEREVFRLSGGYPLFIRELVRDGLLRGKRSSHLALLVEDRVGRLPPDQRRVAEMVAVSEPVHHHLFRQDVASLVPLLRSGLVTWYDQDRVRLEHPYYAACLRENLGPLQSTVYSDLVDRAEGEPVDPVVLAHWMVLAERTPDPDLAESAARLALGSADSAMARRFLVYAGPAASLLEAECLIVDGSIDEGLQALDRVRASGRPAKVQVEAASSASRHLGLTLGDQLTAHHILNAADRPTLPSRLRELLLLGRLWLWLFGPRTDDAGMDLIDDLLTDSKPPDWITYELLQAATAVRYQWAGPAAAVSTMQRTLEIEPQIEATEFGLARTRAVEASFHVHNGDVETGLQILGASDDPGLASATSTRLISGNIALLSAFSGDFERAGAAASAVRNVAAVDDPYRFGEIARLTHSGNFHVSRYGPDPTDWSINPPPPTGVRTLELMLSLREGVLADPTTSIADGVATLVECGAFGWLVFLYADVGDGRQAAIHHMVRDALEGVERSGLWSVAHGAASARCESHSEGLLEAGTRLLQMGFVAGALRAFADVVRATPPGSPTQHEAIRGVVRGLQRWKAPRPEWIRGLPVPTDHQLVVAEKLASGRGVGAIAGEFGVSTRTIENHIYRATRMLGVSGQDELARCLLD